MKRNSSCAEADISGFRDYRNSVGSARAVSLKYSSLQSDDLQSETDGILIGYIVCSADVLYDLYRQLCIKFMQFLKPCWLKHIL